MCGACGAGSARSARLHWSAPFLASVPARSAAARTLTRWSRAAGWTGTVKGVAGGFEVATSSGRRTLAPDLAVVLEQLDAHGMPGDRLLAGSAAGVVEGPATQPGQRPHRSTLPMGPAGPSVGHPSPGTGGASWTLPPDPRRRHRVPGLLAWVSAAESATDLGRLILHLGVSGSDGMVLTSGDAGGITCEAAPAPSDDVLLGTDEAACGELVALLCPR